MTDRVNICENQIKKLFLFYWFFFVKIYSLLTHVRKTPPLKSHYKRYWCWTLCWFFCHWFNKSIVWLQSNGIGNFQKGTIHLGRPKFIGVRGLPRYRTLFSYKPGPMPSFLSYTLRSRIQNVDLFWGPQKFLRASEAGKKKQPQLHCVLK